VGIQLKALWFALFFFPVCAAAAEPIFWSAPEAELANQISPPAGLIQFVVNGEDADDRHLLLECMQQQNLKKGEEAKLFTVVELSLADDSRKAYFVRPALKPYCLTFYGAHLFRYWFITSSVERKHAKYRTLFKNGGDGIGVLATRTNGYRDLLVFNHTAMSQFWTTLAFDGRKYEQVSCEQKDFQDDGSLRSVSCDKR
jgi:hypothetical protein